MGGLESNVTGVLINREIWAQRGTCHSEMRSEIRVRHQLTRDTQDLQIPRRLVTRRAAWVRADTLPCKPAEGVRRASRAVTLTSHRSGGEGAHRTVVGSAV